MITTLLEMFALMGVGVLWSYWQPGKLETDASRQVLTGSVYYLFVPALVLIVLWRTPLGADTFGIVAVAATGILVAVAASLMLCRIARADRATTGAMILASSWPNAIFLGLPILEKTFGPLGTAVAIQFDLFACTPLVLTLGIMVAHAYGAGGKWQAPWRTLLNVPPLWAAFAGLLLNLSGVEPPAWIEGTLRLMGGAAAPLMLISVGMALRQGFTQLRYLGWVAQAALVQLFLMPLTAYLVAWGLDLDPAVRDAVVLDSAMPSMMFGIVLSERFGLNVGVYAAALTGTTLLSLFTLPLWFHWLGGGVL